MLHHVSFNARDPERVAHVLADMMHARALRAPHPPFPEAAWFVCTGDDAGTLIEVMPWGETRDAGTPRGSGFDPQMRPSSGAHVLVGTPRSQEALLAAAAREEWRAELADAGLFRFIKVWVENALLVEFLTPDLLGDYVAAFGSAGAHTLDARLRTLEDKVAAAMRARWG